MPRSVALLTLGCARNEVDSEELAGRLTAAGWRLAPDGEDADAVVVNTCGFIEAAKRESIEVILAAADGRRPVVAVGCLAQRYGAELAGALPEATVLSFDDYDQIGARLDAAVAGRRHIAHQPQDRRQMLPITPVQRHSSSDVGIPGHLGGPRRLRLAAGPVAPLKLASGCDRRCTFCAIPSFRGAFVSRPADELVAEGHWLAERGVRELLLVSENSTSYGKDFGDLRALERLLPRLAEIPGIVRVRLSYLQPAEMRPSLVEALAATPSVAAYFDLSFQHASAGLLRRMRRFGSGERFLALLDEVRRLAPQAGVRSNFIVGFPGETRADVAELRRFLEAADLDAAGVFGYSDEDGTEAATYAAKLSQATIRRRLARVTALVEELTAQRAQARIGEHVEVLVESVDGGIAEGRATHQGPEDGVTTWPARGVRLGDLVRVRVVEASGCDLRGQLVEVLDSVAPAGRATERR